MNPYRIGLTMPVVLQNDALLRLTLKALSTLRLADDWRERHGAALFVYVVCNRLTVCTADELARRCLLELPAHVVLSVIHEQDRSVAGAWNRGAELALKDDCGTLVWMANDTELRSGTLETLVDYGVRRQDVAFWSGVQEREARDDVAEDADSTGGCDCSLFASRPESLEQYGWFDGGFRPAYYEDNDMAARVWLAGGYIRVVHAARFYHHGSQTRQLDAEMAHHVNHWFPVNHARFLKKWGFRQAVSRDDARTNYFKHPFNDPSLPLNHCPDRDGFDPGVRQAMLDATDPRKAAFERACAANTDIHEHLPVMAEYAARCDHVTEFGVGTGQSTRAWLYAQPAKLVCYDSAPPCEAVMELLLPLRGRTEVVFHLADSRRISIEPTDLLFVDSTHSFNHLLVELLLHAPQTRKYILLHDTTIFGHRGDDNISPGIWYAIEDFLLRFPEWKLVERRMNCNGLTILERVPLTPSM